MRAVDLDLEQVGQRLHNYIESSREQQHSMPRPLVLADAAHALRVDSTQSHGVQRLASQAFHDLVIEALVLAVERALEIGARAPLEVQPPRSLAKHLGHERRPILQRLRAQPHP